MKKNLQILIGCLFFWASVSAQLLTDSTNLKLNVVDVVGQRTYLNTASGRLLTVIDKQSIAKMPVNSLDQLLESLSSVDIRQRGVGGTQADISIRGGSFDQVLILLNGVNITDPQTGHYNLDIPVELSDVQSVEILQGSAARMYGPNAFSGAINIVTNNQEKSQLSAQLTAGSFDTFMQSLSGTIRAGKISSFNTITHKSSAGYIPNTDYQMLNAFSHTTFSANKYGTFDLQLGYQQKSYGANAFYSFKYPLQFDYTKTFFGALNWQYTSGIATIASQAYFRKHYDRFELYRDSITNKPSWYTGHNYHLTDVSGGKISTVLRFPFATATLGMELRNEHIYSNQLGIKMDSSVNNPFDDRQDFTKKDNRFFSNAFIDLSKSIGSLYLSAGGSLSNSAQFGSIWFGGFNASYQFNSDFRVYTSVNNGVNLPTYTDLYLTNSLQKGNINLKPGKSTTLEFGAKYDKKQLKLSGVAYYRLGKDVIDWVKYPGNSYWQSINHDKLNAFGFDFSANQTFNDCFISQVNLAYSYIKMENDALNFDSKYAFDYLRNKVLLSVNHKIVKNVTAQWSASYNDRAGNYVLVDNQPAIDYTPFFMLDARLLWNVKYLDVFADVNNILDTDYADFGGLPQPGVNFNVGLRLKIK